MAAHIYHFTIKKTTPPCYKIVNCLQPHGFLVLLHICQNNNRLICHKPIIVFLISRPIIVNMQTG
jgi:hypothetical protein